MALGAALICVCIAALLLASPAITTSPTNDPSSTAPSSLSQATTQVRTEAVQASKPAYDPSVILATLADNSTPDDALAQLNEIPELAGMAIESVEDGIVKLTLPEGIDPAEAAKLATTAQGIAAAQPNYRYYIQDEATSLTQTQAQTSLIVATQQVITAQAAAPNDTYYARQWALTSMNVPQAWETALSSAVQHPVTVAVIDAGFLVSHEDLASNIVAPYDVTTKSSTIKADNTTASSLNHGTHVAGIISALTDNAKGIAGVTHNTAKVMPIRVEDSKGNMDTSTLVSAYSYIMARAKLYNIHVVNISLGAGSDEPVTSSTDPLLHAAIDTARGSGIVTVTAACNEDEYYDPPFYAYPSDFDNVISVIDLAQQYGTTNVQRDSGSNYNVAGQQSKNISAPGTSILSLYGKQRTSGTYKGTLYGEMSGTSMAAPNVSGVLAFMFAADPALTVDEATSKLYSTAKDLGAAGWDRYYGYGEVDAAAAVAGNVPYLSGTTTLSTTTSRLTVKVAGETQPAANYTWTSSNPAVATVSADGTVTEHMAGEATITATDKKTGATASQVVRVTRQVSLLNITIAAQTYNGSSITPTPVVFDGSKRLTYGEDYVAYYSSNLNAGTAYATIVGSGDYTGTVTKPFTINKAPLSKASIKLSATSFTYNGKTKKPTVTVTDIGSNASTKLVSKTDYALSNPGTKLGTGTVKVTATSACKNFTGTVTKTYKVTIKKKAVYQLYNRRTGAWFYTISKAERKSFRKAGWTSKGTAWKAPSASAKKVYRYYNSKTGSYRYVTKKLKSKAWKYRGVAFYADDYKTHRVYTLYNPKTHKYRYTKAKKVPTGYVRKSAKFYAL